MLYPNGHWRRECRTGFYFSYLFGLRVIDFNDNAAFHSQGTWTNGNNVTQPVSGDYDVTVRNRLLGAQIGAEYTYRQCRWNFDVHGKVAPCLNIADNYQSIVTHAFGIDPFAASDLNSHPQISRDGAAVVGEVGLSITYKFRPNLIGRASYDFIWIGGVALAPMQYQFVSDPKPQIDSGATLFLNGLSLGLEYTW